MVKYYTLEARLYKPSQIQCKVISSFQVANIRLKIYCS